MSKKPSGPAVPASVVYADEWVERLQRHLPQTLTWDADAIHQSRVATRRLGAALDVLEPVLSNGHRRDLARVLKRLRRQLGPLRDLDVMLDQLDAFRPGPGVDWLRQRLTDDRADCRAGADIHPTKTLAKLGTWLAVRQEWVEAAHAVDSLTANAVHLQLDAFAEHATAAGGHDPHALRIAAKGLRYTLEMAVESGRSLPAAVAKAFKRMQDALGGWHDMVVLAERALRATLDTQLAYHDPATHLAVADVARTAVRRSQRHMAAFTDLWRKQGTTLAETIRTALPVTELKTGPDRPGSTGTPDPAPPGPADPAAV